MVAQVIRPVGAAAEVVIAEVAIADQALVK